MFFYLLSCGSTSKVTHQPGRYIFIQQFPATKATQSFIFNKSRAATWATVIVRWPVMSWEKLHLMQISSSTCMDLKMRWRQCCPSDLSTHHVYIQFSKPMWVSGQRWYSPGFGTEPKHTSTDALIGSFGSRPAVCKFSSITPLMYSHSSSTSLSLLIRDRHYPSHSLSSGGVGDVTFSVGSGTRTGPCWLLCHGKLIAWGVSEASGGVQAPTKLHTWCSVTRVHTRARLRRAWHGMEKSDGNICQCTDMRIQCVHNILGGLYLDLV